MIVIMKPGCPRQLIEQVVKKVESLGLSVYLSTGTETTIIGLIGDTSKIPREQLEIMPGVDKIMRVVEPYKLVNRKFHPKDHAVKVGNVKIGGNGFTMIAGPCAVENEQTLMEIARSVKALGANMLRGGAFKPRSSPHSFQGLGEEGLKLLANARDETGLPVVTEVMEPSQITLVCEYADMLQVGARNMQNFNLLKGVGKAGKPVLLKRGMSATIEETLCAAEYIVAEGNPDVVICERGIRTFETYMRNTLDLAGALAMKNLSYLPVISDPSHATGRRELIAPLVKASLACGLDGTIIEVHSCPEKALCDGPQALRLDDFAVLMLDINKMKAAMR